METKNVIMKVVRDIFNTLSTLSINYINHERVGYIIEDTVRPKGVKIKDKTAIPYGTYLLGTRFSPKFSKYFFWSDKHKKLIDAISYSKLSNKEDYKIHDVIWIKDVPDYDFILLHWGNTQADTSGCLIVGTERTKDSVTNSKNNYMKIYPILYPLVLEGNKHIEITK